MKKDLALLMLILFVFGFFYFGLSGIRLTNSITGKITVDYANKASVADKILASLQTNQINHGNINLNTEPKFIEPGENARAINILSYSEWDFPYIVNGVNYLYCSNGRVRGEDSLKCNSSGNLIGSNKLFCIGDTAKNEGQIIGVPNNLNRLTCSKRQFYMNLQKIPAKSLRLSPLWQVTELTNKNFVSGYAALDYKYGLMPKMIYTPYSRKVLEKYIDSRYKINMQNLMNDKKTLKNYTGEKQENPKEEKQDGYLIITRPIFVGGLEKFKKIKESMGYAVHITTIEDIIKSSTPFDSLKYDGKDIQETIKNFLKALKESSPNIKYVLLIGHPRAFVSVENADNTVELMEAQYTTQLKYDWELPIRYIYPEKGWSDGSGGEGIPSDQYYASAAAEWDKDNDSIYGEFENEEYSFEPDFYVGRIPAKTAEQLKIFIERNDGWKPKELLVESSFLSAHCLDKSDSDYNKLYSYMHKIKLHNCKEENGGDEALLAGADNADYISSFSHSMYERVSGEYNMDLGSKFSGNPILFLHGCEVGGLDYGQVDLAFGAKHLLSNEGITAFIGSTRSMPDIHFNYKDYIFFGEYEKIGDAFYNYKYKENSERFLSKREKILFLMFLV